METKFAQFNYIGELELPESVVDQCSHSGDCFPDIVECIKIPMIENQLKALDPEKLAKELKEYGAWEPEQLAIHEDNLQRILWIAACNIDEENHSDNE